MALPTLVSLSDFAVTDRQILSIVEGLYGEKPGYDLLETYRDYVANSDIPTFTQALVDAHPLANDHAALAAEVAANFGVNSDTATADNIQKAIDFLTAQFANKGVAETIKKVALNWSRPDTDPKNAIWKDAADVFKASVLSSLEYSTDPENTEPADGGNLGETLLLTTAIDNVEIQTAGTVDTVKGMINDDGTDDLDTFSSGDLITGNGLTEVEVTVVDEDGVDYVEMSGVNALNIKAAGETGTVTFDASTYGSDISEIKLFGADSLHANVENVEFDEEVDLSVEIGTSGTLDVNDGLLDGWNVSADLDAGSAANGAEASFNSVGDISVFAGDESDVSFTLMMTDSATSADATVGDVNLGAISIVAEGDATAYLDITISADAIGSGDATVGNVIVGDVDLSVGTGWASLDYVGQWAYADNGNATVGDMTIGDVSLLNTGSVSFSQWANVTSNGAATVGDLTVGNVDMNIVETNDWQGVYIWHWDRVNAGSGDATVGDITVGDISFDAAKSASFDVSVEASARQDGSGDATVGDITIGNITGTMADDAEDGYIFEWAKAYADTGDATVGNLTVGDVDVTLGESASVTVSLTGAATATVTGDATVGNLTVGDVNLVAASGASGYFELSATARADIGNSTVGNISIGNVTANMGLSSELYVVVDATASTTAGTAAAIGDVSVGNITLDGSLALSASASLSVSLDSDGTIGAVTVGDVDADLLSDSWVGYYVYADAAGAMGAVDLGTVNVVADSIDYSVDITAGDLTAGINIADVTLAGADVSFSAIDINGSGDIGDVAIGNIDISGTTSVNIAGTGISVSATGDINSVAIGNINIDSANSETLNINVWAGDNLGDVTIGNIDVNGASTSGMDVDVDVDGSADVGNVTLGDIMLAGAVSDSVVANLYFDAAAGDSLGNVTVGDIILSSSAGADNDAWASVTMSVGNSAATVGDISVGDITLAGTNENVATGADGVSDWAGSGVYIYADQGSSNSSLIVGDLDITLTNSVDDSTAFTAGHEYNIAYGSLSITSDSAITVGDISVSAVNDSIVDVEGGIDTQGLFQVNINLTADSGGEGITIGDITVVGGDVDTASVALDNFATLTGFLSLSGDTITVGDIDYSGYATSASIDVSGYAGAANITAAQGDTTITVNSSENAVTLGGGSDSVVYTVAEASGTTYADIDKVSNFTAGDDQIDFSALGTNTADVGGTVADYDAFLVAAQSAMSFDSTIDVFAMNDGTNTYVAIDSNGDDVINFAIELSGITSVTAGDFVV